MLVGEGVIRDRVGPMAWGSQGMVFLGEDLMHTRDYSDETSRVIDEEVERILRAEEERATAELAKHRAGLDAVAAALLENETVDGAEVKRLVDEAAGHEVHAYPVGETVPSFADPIPDGRPDPESTPARAPTPDPSPVAVDREPEPAPADWDDTTQVLER
jgi:hypothetical protein